MLSCFPAPRGGSGTEACFCHRVTLDKRSTVSLFGDDISPIVLDVEFQTNTRLRIKVSVPPALFQSSALCPTSVGDRACSQRGWQLLCSWHEHMHPQ